MHGTGTRWRVRVAVGAVATAAFALLVLAACSSPSSSGSDSVSIGSTAPVPSTAPPIAASTTTTIGPVLAGRIIVIDPGHNGGNAAHSAEIARQVFIGTGMKECDTSGTATYDGYAEHTHNWDVSQRLAELLRADGATVVFTHPDDVGWGPCITERAQIGNDARADVAVSIHADGGPDGGRGFHVLHPSPVTAQSTAISEPSARLAVAIRDAFAAATAMPTSTYAGSAGLMPRGDLGGLNLSIVPKVFVEAGNMRNAVDAALLADPAFRQREAEGIAAGIARYLGGN